MSEEQKEINWSKFVIGDQKYFKVQENVEYAISFKPALEQIEVPIDDLDVDGKPITKMIPALRMHVDVIDSKPVDLTIDVTSKRWIALIKQFFDKGMLYTYVFSLTKKGEKFDTTYQFYPVSPKKGIKI